MAKMAKPGSLIQGTGLSRQGVFDDNDVLSVFMGIALKAFGQDYYRKVVDLLWDDVLRDVKETSEFPKRFNFDDVRLAFGRALCKKLGLEEQ